MLVQVAGTGPHEEDAWIGGTVRIGEALVRVTKQDARCRMTTRNPDTGVRDFDTLRAIKDYRGVRDGKTIDFGVYAEVVEPGPRPGRRPRRAELGPAADFSPVPQVHARAAPPWEGGDHPRTRC